MKNEKKGLRILHVTHNMSVGGAEVVVAQLIKSLAKNNRYHNQIVCLDGIIGDLGKALKEQGIGIHCLSRMPGFDHSLISQLRKLVKREKIDVLHCHQYTPFSYGVLSAMFTDVNVVFTEHGRLYPDTWSWKRRIVANTVVAISAATKDALVHYEWFNRNKINIIYNGIVGLSGSTVNTTLRKELGISTSDLVIGTVSRLDPIKNQALMVAAFARILPICPHAKLLLVGDGPERNRLEAQIESLGIKKNVVISGFVQDVASYLSLIDVFLLTSFTEGTSMALLEAMSLAKPIIATSVGGNVELFKHNETALLIDSDDENGLVVHLKAMLDDSELRERLGKASYTNFHENYNVAQMTSEYVDFYEKK